MSEVPRAIGIIMDGNRRWARERGMPSLEGHRMGAERVRDTVRWARDAGVSEVVFYTFSTENWNRSQEEVGYLMRLVEEFFSSELSTLVEQGARIRFIGERTRLSDRLRSILDEAEGSSKENNRITVTFAFSYGGRAEILEAVNTFLKEGRAAVSEEEFSAGLWSAGLHDPDLIIRTGGERRLSNFLPWQSVYSELAFTDTKWPDFSEEEFRAILEDYGTRERRKGK